MAQVNAVIARCPLFRSLPRLRQQLVQDEAVAKSYRRGDWILREDRKGLGLYVIRSGRVRVARSDSDAPAHLATLSPGDCFGEMSLFNSLPHSAGVQALTDVSAWYFPQDAFTKLLRRHPLIGVEVLARLLDVVGNRLRESDEQVVTLVSWKHST